MLVLLVEYIFLDLLLWSIFQSSITHYVKQFFQVISCFMVTCCGQLSYTSSTPVFLTCGHYQVVFLANFCSCHMILESSYVSTSLVLFLPPLQFWPHFWTSSCTVHGTVLKPVFLILVCSCRQLETRRHRESWRHQESCQKQRRLSQGSFIQIARLSN